MKSKREMVVDFFKALIATLGALIIIYIVFNYRLPLMIYTESVSNLVFVITIVASLLVVRPLWVKAFTNQ